MANHSSLDVFGCIENVLAAIAPDSLDLVCRQLEPEPVLYLRVRDSDLARKLWSLGAGS